MIVEGFGIGIFLHLFPLIPLNRQPSVIPIWPEFSVTGRSCQRGLKLLWICLAFVRISVIIFQSEYPTSVKKSVNKCYINTVIIVIYLFIIIKRAAAVSLQVKELGRNLGLHAGSHFGEKRALRFFPLDFWRKPKSAADGSRMSLRDNLGRAWKASQEAAALKCWAGLHWIKGRRPTPYAPRCYA